jgi:hypothetical protein
MLMSLGSLKTERVLACLIQLSKNRLPVWQESNSGFADCNTAFKVVKAKWHPQKKLSTMRIVEGGYAEPETPQSFDS